VVFPDRLYRTPSRSSSIKTSDRTQEDSESPKPVDDGEIQIEFSSDYRYCPNIWAVTNKQQKNVKILGQYIFCLIIQNI